MIEHGDDLIKIFDKNTLLKIIEYYSKKWWKKKIYVRNDDLIFGKDYMSKDLYFANLVLAFYTIHMV